MKTQQLSCLLFTMAATANAGSLRRRLQTQAEESFLWYEPFTTVTDHAAIDLDQQKLQDELGKLNFHQARAIYQEGGFSHPYAILTLDRPLRSPAHKGMDITGKATDGIQPLLGKVRTTAKANATTLEVEYHASPFQDDIRSSCRVGANPNPISEGCFANSGSIEIETLGIYTYTYNALTDNDNEVTLQSFSTEAKEKMWDCQFGAGHSNCPYPTYTKFYQYYGVFDYGDQWIQAAFDKTQTDFVHGNADFSQYTDNGRAEAIQRATVQLNLWMMVIREMEHSIEICEYTKDDDDHLRSWDKAVAYYFGSVAKQAKGKDYKGYSLFTLAEHRCLFAGTCVDENALGETMSISRVNDDILKNFKLGQSVLLERQCDAARTMARRIMSDMIIPLVQGTLRYAYQQDSTTSHTAEMQDVLGHDLEAEGAAFAAGILPLLHSCSIADADLLHKNMGVGSGTEVNFNTVKSILERNYNCMGITCEDVGGIADVTGRQDYLGDGEPCVSYDSPSHAFSAGSSSGSESYQSPSHAFATGSSSNNKPLASSHNIGQLSGNNEEDNGATLTSFNGNVALAVGMVLGIGIIIFLAAWYLSRRRAAAKQQELTKPEPTMPLDEVVID